MAEAQSNAPAPTGAVRDRNNPVDPAGAFRVVRGNLAPTGTHKAIGRDGVAASS